MIPMNRDSILFENRRNVPDTIMFADTLDKKSNSISQHESNKMSLPRESFARGIPNWQGETITRLVTSGTERHNKKDIKERNT